MRRSNVSKSPIYRILWLGLNNVRGQGRGSVRAAVQTSFEEMTEWLPQIDAQKKLKGD